MNEGFYRHCDILLKKLPSKGILYDSEVADLLNVSQKYALTVMERLKSDGLADQCGVGPISQNKRTSVFPDFYLDEIKKLKQEHNTYLYARWGFWIAVISALWQISEWILGLIIKKG